MKKIKCLILLLLITFVVTGCVKFNSTMDIKKDKSLDFSVIYALDKTVFGEETSLKDEDFKEAEKQGFTIKEYKDGNMEGFTLLKRIKNIDEVSTENDTEFDLSGLMKENAQGKYIFKVVKGKDKNTYYAKFKFDANDSGLSTEGSDESDEALPDESDDSFLTTENGFDDMDLSGMMSSLDLSFNVNLPYPAISNNATTSEDNNKKLSWKLSSAKKEYIEFAFELKNNDSDFNMMYVYIGVGLFVFIIVAILLIVLGKKKNNEGNTPAVEKNYVQQNSDTPEPQKLNNNEVDEVNGINNKE